MARTDSDTVKGVLRLGSVGGDYDDVVGNPSLIPYIDAATLVVDRVASCAARRSRTLSTDELLKIETWLAAHFYAMSDQTYSSKSTSGASGSFHGQTGMNLDATKYGQTAKTLDYSGCLTAIDKRAFAGFTWLGKVPSEQVPYDQRD